MCIHRLLVDNRIVFSFNVPKQNIHHRSQVPKPRRHTVSGYRCRMQWCLEVKDGGKHTPTV